MADVNYFTELNKIDVSAKVEKKGNLSYLSWVWAWCELKKLHPDATYAIYENADGLFYHTDGKTCWVKTGVTVNGIEHIEYLPVMDYKNRSIPLENVTSMDVNKAIQRSLTKAVARHGLGLYIYAGEDLPEETAEQNKTQQKQQSREEIEADAEKRAEAKKKRADMIGRIKVLCKETGKNMTKPFTDMPDKELEAVIKALEKLPKMENKED